ncbi:uncharacterized [Tachysurus ichikawai]
MESIPRALCMRQEYTLYGSRTYTRSDTSVVDSSPSLCFPENREGTHMCTGTPHGKGPVDRQAVRRRR